MCTSLLSVMFVGSSLMRKLGKIQESVSGFKFFAESKATKCEVQDWYVMIFLVSIFVGQLYSILIVAS